MTYNFQNKNKLLIISLLSGFIGFLIKLIYRPLIIENKINDFGIHGFSPSLFYTLGFCLFIAFWLKKGHIKAMIFCTIGILAYEIEQIWTTRTFDYLDTAAIIFGLGLSILIFKRISKKARLSVSDEFVVD